jgi:hypothetical protein
LATKLWLATNKVLLVGIFAVAGNVEELIVAGAVVIGYVVFAFSWVPFHRPVFTNGWTPYRKRPAFLRVTRLGESAEATAYMGLWAFVPSPEVMTFPAASYKASVP